MSDGGSCDFNSLNYFNNMIKLSCHTCVRFDSKKPLQQNVEHLRMHNSVPKLLRSFSTSQMKVTGCQKPCFIATTVQLIVGWGKILDRWFLPVYIVTGSVSDDRAILPISESWTECFIQKVNSWDILFMLPWGWFRNRDETFHFPTDIER